MGGTSPIKPPPMKDSRSRRSLSGAKWAGLSTELTQSSWPASVCVAAPRGFSAHTLPLRGRPSRFLVHSLTDDNFFPFEKFSTKTIFKISSWRLFAELFAEFVFCEMPIDQIPCNCQEHEILHQIMPGQHFHHLHKYLRIHECPFSQRRSSNITPETRLLL